MAMVHDTPRANAVGHACKNFKNLYLGQYLADRGRICTNGTLEGRTALWATSGELWSSFEKVEVT
jgi:hypothetical protein